MEKISEHEYRMFLNDLNPIFERNIHGKDNELPTKEDAEKLGVKLNWVKVQKNLKLIDDSSMSCNEFHIYTKTKGKLIYSFWKGLRDCASHEGLITKLEISNEIYYLFKCSDMKGIIKEKDWNTYITSLIKLCGISLESKIYL